jgi:hypothetical protein
MTGIKRLLVPIAILLVAGTLTACGSSVSIPSATTPLQASDDLTAAKKGSCPPDKGVSVKPCAVELTAKKSTVTVTTKGPSGGTFTVKDTGCATRLVATVSGSGDSYSISAGTKQGECVVTFVDYSSGNKRLGAAKVIVINSIPKKHKHKP